MDYKIKGYKPEKLFNFFEDICAIPHGSGNEKALSDFLVEFAKKRNLEVYQDSSLNVVIKKDASAGYENAPTVMLQGHIDMVCEKLAGVEHDFEKDGLDLIVENGVLRANGTTLGADNGVAVALMMTVLDDDTIKHPALECVFTTEEEIGLNGANTLDKSMLNAKIMINMDSEEEGVGTVSCAGGMRYSMLKNAKREQNTGYVLSLSVRGLLGGHSGMDIDKERVNAIKLMGRVVNNIQSNAKLISFAGGTKDNAIPRECDAKLLFIDKTEAEKAMDCLKVISDELNAEIHPTEPNFALNFELSNNTQTVNTLCNAKSFINAICLAPNGVRRKNPNQGNFVVTSLNLGIADTECEPMRIVFAPRSSVNSLQDDTVQMLDILADTFGFETQIAGKYPGWAFSEVSPIRDAFQKSYKKLFNQDMKIEAIHAGLECGLFCDAMKDLDAIAVGPTLCDVHTPDEHLLLDSFERFYTLLTDVLSSLS